MTLWKIFEKSKLKSEMDCLRFFMMEKVLIIKLADVTLWNIHNPTVTTRIYHQNTPLLPKQINPSKEFQQWSEKKMKKMNWIAEKNRLKVATRRQKQQQCVQQVAADAINYDFFFSLLLLYLFVEFVM